MGNIRFYTVMPIVRAKYTLSEEASGCGEASQQLRRGYVYSLVNLFYFLMELFIRCRLIRKKKFLVCYFDLEAKVFTSFSVPCDHSDSYGNNRLYILQGRLC